MVPHTHLRSVQTMQLCSLGQGTVSPWSIFPRCPRVLQVFPTMSDSWDCESWDTRELSDTVVGSTCNTLGQRGTMLHAETLSLVPRSQVASSEPTFSLRFPTVYSYDGERHSTSMEKRLLAWQQKIYLKS